MPTYIWVTDDTTGHQYDVDERTLRPGMTPVKGHPPNSGPGARPRQPKHRVGKDGKAAPPRGRTPTPSADTAAAAAPTPKGQPA
jgi:hypothetical protein